MDAIVHAGHVFLEQGRAVRQLREAVELVGGEHLGEGGDVTDAFEDHPAAEGVVETADLVRNVGHQAARHVETGFRQQPHLEWLGVIRAGVARRIDRRTTRRREHGGELSLEGVQRGDAPGVEVLADRVAYEDRCHRSGSLAAAAEDPILEPAVDQVLLNRVAAGMILVDQLERLAVLAEMADHSRRNGVRARADDENHDRTSRAAAAT